MKINNLKLDKACNEHWDKMAPNKDGRFCELCAKTVIDFTHLSPEDMHRKIKASNGTICAKLTKTQLATPILDGEKLKDYKLPYSKVAAGVMLVAALQSVQSCKENPESPQTEYVASDRSNRPDQLRQKTEPRTVKKETTTFKGQIFSKDSLPLENAKVSYVTINKLYTTTTDQRGQFELEIPNDIVAQYNVIRLTFDDVIYPKREPNGNNSFPFEYYENDDLILSKDDIANDFAFYAEPDGLYLGGIGLYAHEAKYNPLVIVDGVEVPFKEFEKSRFGKKSTCNLENKAYYHFDYKAAVALCGEKAKHGLYLFFSKDL